ncbi:Protein kinase domain [Trypanosoma vivax]|uniref:Protein kinase domain-containing protein n=1 Tax=Trypanosoma vivax (strain Y486) TaxID=1055687 RepID=G0TS87_TRYVY|nr:putative protein kinase [Trypanosoma vivax]KAH8605567.1 Protein kinase domain [Trypanosoma vivax]KAH8619844.1 Protein kinase domain [Trypanosoma vivax]CCC46813.1 putative protein kinase [Trypanosoma vivax Y486]
MENYQLLNQLGDGTFGCVLKALHKTSGQIVAIKKMKQKFYSWEECMKLPEVVVVRRIHGHPNIVKMREVIREKNELYFVFEYMDGDLLGVIRKAKQAQSYAAGASAPAIAYPKIKSYTFQILQSLAYLHRSGYFHRDMKPENLLVKKDPASTPQEIVKLADFGLVKEIRARPPYTDYVSTRWYRAPELLLQDRSYSAPVDIWAVGCILAELITTRPLFAGSNEVDQLHKIMGVLGSPNEQVWPSGMSLAKKIRYSFPAITGVGLERIMPSHVPAQAMDLMKQMLCYDPKKRPTAQQCLQHPFFSVGVDEENFALPIATKQQGNTVKKSAVVPQSAPSGNSSQNAGNKQERSPAAATTALPKDQGSTNCPPIARPLKIGGPSASNASSSANENSRVPYMLKSTPISSTTDIPTRTTTVLPKVGGAQVKSTTVSAEPSGAGKEGVDIDELIDEFAGELKTLGLLPQQKQQATAHLPPAGTTSMPPLVSDASRGAEENGVAGAKSQETGSGLVETLLNSTRYKRSSLNTQDNAPSSNSPGVVSQQRKLSGAPGPTVCPLPHAVSPSIQTLLARHREGSGRPGN